MTTPTAPDPGIEAGAAAVYAQMRGMALAQAHPSEFAVLRRVLPEEFEDLDLPRQLHYRLVARAAVDAWRLYAQLNGTRP